MVQGIIFHKRERQWDSVPLCYVCGRGGGDSGYMSEVGQSGIKGTTSQVGENGILLCHKWDSASCVRSGIQLTMSEVGERVGFSYVTSGRDSGIQVTMSEVGATV